MIRQLVREMLLQESESPTARAASLGMAVLKTVTPQSGNDCVIIYSPTLLTACLERARDGKIRLGRALWDTLQAKDPVVKSGVVLVASRARQCNERPQVSAAAAAPGSGMGPSAYEAAMWYAGGLHSDRKETSSSAGSVWSKYRGRSIDGDVEALPMDDISDPKTPQVEDDCEMQDREWLNYTYKLRSKPPGLDELERNHRTMMSSLTGYGFSPEEIGKELHVLFLTMFKRRMGL